MGKKALTYWAGLIGVYIVVANATGFGKALGAGEKFVRGTTKTLQGRG